MDCHTAFRIYFIILKFSGIRRDFLVRYTGSEASVNPVGCNRSNFSLIRIVFTAFSCKRNNLEIQLLPDCEVLRLSAGINNSCAWLGFAQSYYPNFYQDLRGPIASANTYKLLLVFSCMREALSI